MKWDKLIVQNFLAINDAEIDLDNQGLILIEGENTSDEKFASNGAGKSSLIPESITWCLYNKTSKGLKGDAVVNNKTKKNTMVALIGELDGDTYRIERYRKHALHDNKVRLFRNDIDITAKSNDDTNAEIEKLLKISHLTFINSILFAQGEGLGAFASLTDARKKEILDSLLNLDIYSTAQEIAKKKVKEAIERIEAKKREIERLEWDLEQVDKLEEQDIKNYETTKDMLKDEQKQLADVIKLQNDYPAKYFGFVEQKRDNIVALNKKLDELSNIDMSVEEAEFNRAHRALNEIENQQRDLERQKTELVKRYKSLSFSDNCPVCGTPMDNSHKIAEQDNIKNELRPVMLGIQQIEQTKQPYIDAVNEARARYDEKIVEQKTVVQRQREITTEINRDEDYIRTYEINLRQLKSNVEVVKETIKKLQNVPEPVSRDKERETINKAINVAKKELVALELAKKEDEDVVKVYSNEGVKSHVLDFITPELNQRGNKYLKQLAGENMELVFSTRTKKKDGTYSDKFDVQLINTVGGDDYKAQSGGEKKRADLSISLALQDLILENTNFIVYDEVFDALDEVGIESVIELLKERVKSIGTIFVITQSSHFKALFEKVITITKDKQGISTIKRGKQIA
ncbi:exonuclease I [Bacillus phage Flapjack]|uniref:Exonuclease I n=1 Tax=Bacillus phage Flapjack TaxID=1983465 RepID=A0A1X9SFX2_9CAUD|nr:exonuclease I [Bacillus phage Flapjack]